MTAPYDLDMTNKVLDTDVDDQKQIEDLVRVIASLRSNPTQLLRLMNDLDAESLRALCSMGQGLVQFCAVNDVWRTRLRDQYSNDTMMPVDDFLRIFAPPNVVPRLEPDLYLVYRTYQSVHTLISNAVEWWTRMQGSSATGFLTYTTRLRLMRRSDFQALAVRAQASGVTVDAFSAHWERSVVPGQLSKSVATFATVYDDSSLDMTVELSALRTMDERTTRATTNSETAVTLELPRVADDALPLVTFEQMPGYDKTRTLRRPHHQHGYGSRAKEKRMFVLQDAFHHIHAHDGPSEARVGSRLVTLLGGIVYALYNNGYIIVNMAEDGSPTLPAAAHSGRKPTYAYNRLMSRYETLPMDVKMEHFRTINHAISVADRVVPAVLPKPDILRRLRQVSPTTKSNRQQTEVILAQTRRFLDDDGLLWLVDTYLPSVLRRRDGKITDPLRSWNAWVVRSGNASALIDPDAYRRIMLAYGWVVRMDSGSKGKIKKSTPPVAFRELHQLLYMARKIALAERVILQVGEVRQRAETHEVVDQLRAQLKMHAAHLEAMTREVAQARTTFGYYEKTVTALMAENERLRAALTDARGVDPRVHPLDNMAALPAELSRDLNEALDRITADVARMEQAQGEDAGHLLAELAEEESETAETSRPYLRGLFSDLYASAVTVLGYGDSADGSEDSDTIDALVGSHPEEGDHPMRVATSQLAIAILAANDQYCNTCYINTRTTSCGICRMRHYCSKECQNRDWHEGHEVSCGFQ